MRTCSPIPRSRRSTIRCPTSCTCPGRSARSKRASTFCARSRSRSTRTRRALCSTRAGAPASWSPKPSWCASTRNGGARERSRVRAPSATCARSRPSFPIRLTDADNIRNRPPGGGGLYDIGCYAILTARYVFAAEPTRVVAALDVDPAFGADRLASALIEFPGGRHLTFTCATQLCRASARHHRRRGGPHRSRHSLQRADRPADANPRRQRRRSRRRRRARRGIPGVRSIYAARRRLLARNSWRGAARISHRGRHRQHARDRRRLPLGAPRRLGGSVRAAAGRFSIEAARRLARRRLLLDLGVVMAPNAQDSLERGQAAISIAGKRLAMSMTPMRRPSMAMTPRKKSLAVSAAMSGVGWICSSPAVKISETPSTSRPAT